MSMYAFHNLLEFACIRLYRPRAARRAHHFLNSENSFIENKIGSADDYGIPT